MAGNRNPNSPDHLIHRVAIVGGQTIFRINVITKEPNVANGHVWANMGMLLISADSIVALVQIIKEGYWRNSLW